MPASAARPVNVALAYPPTAKPASRLLSFALCLGCVIALALYIPDNFLKRSALRAISVLAPLGAPVPRLAVCYSGHLGTFAHVFHQNLEVLRAADAQAHIFFYVDPQDDYRHEHTQEHYTFVHEMPQLEGAFRAMKTRAVRTFAVSAVEKPPTSKCYMRESGDDAHYTRAFVELYAANECYKMVQAEEKSLGIEYEWILRLQPNMEIKVNMPPSNVTTRVHMSGAAMALVPRKMADEFFSVVNAFQPGECDVLDTMGGAPCENYSYQHDSVECLQIKWLSLANIVPSNGVYVNRRIAYPTAQ